MFSALALVLTTLAADPLAKANEHLTRAAAALEKKDYATYVAEYEAAIRAGAEHPRIIYNLAAGHALLGDAARASAELGKLAELGLSEAVLEDKNFAGIKDAPAFRAVVARFEKNLAPTRNSRVFMTLDDPKIRAEGISYDPKDNAYYLGSIDLTKIVRADARGKTESFSVPQDGLWAVLGLAIDTDRRELWASSSSHDEKKPASGLFRYDLKTKKLKNKYLLPEDRKPHFLGDVIVASNGEIFATDSMVAAVYRLAPGAERLESWVPVDQFRSPQGLCFSGDEKAIFVADYSRGLFAIDRATKVVRKLSAPKSTTVVGVDGLYYYRGRLIATQSGVRPNRVLSLTLDREARAIERVDVLESNHPSFEEPRLGTIVGDKLFYVVAPSLVLELPLSAK